MIHDNATIYVVCEFPHGYEDDIHRIVMVTADKELAEAKADDITYFIEEFKLALRPPSVPRRVDAQDILTEMREGS